MKRVWKGLGVLFVLVLFSACGAKSTADVALEDDQTPFTWWADRTKNFGETDYSGSKEDIQTQLEDTYQVELLPSFTAIEALIEEEYNVAPLVQEDPTYKLLASENTMTVESQLEFKEDEDLRVYGVVKEEFVYLPKLKQAKVKRQQLELKFEQGPAKYFGKDFTAFIQSLSDSMDVPASSVTAFLEQLGHAEEVSNQVLTIYDDNSKGEDRRTFGKALKVEFGENGNPKAVYVYTVDYRE